ncbi:MAG: hypothetical protein ACI8QC_004227, partial [Planctomycetota bacterium]
MGLCVNPRSALGYVDRVEVISMVKWIVKLNF